MARRQAAALTLSIALAGGVAAADHLPPREFETAEECMQSGGVGFDHLPSCSRSGDGPWVARYGGIDAGGGGGAFGAFLLIALIWAAAPAVISGFIASDRGQSVGLAVLLGLFLGWIGLLIVVFAFKEDVARAARNVIDSAANRPAVSASPARAASERLAELERLRNENLITEDEYAQRRARILDEL